jgi:hypothetical protein
MLLNETRGSNGMYSRAGRNSTEKFHILLKKDEILNGQNRKLKIKDMYTPDYNPYKNQTDNEIDMFNIEPVEKKLKKEEKILMIKGKGSTKEKNAIAEYLEMRKVHKRSFENPSCTKYNPKCEYLWKRTLTGPTWDKAPLRNQKRRLRRRDGNGKEYELVETKYDDVKFYLSHTDFKPQGKNFVDLKRQTQRAEFGAHSDVRIRNIHSADSTNRDIKTADTKKPETSPGGKKLNMTVAAHSANKKWIKIQAPDFKKTMSREQLEKVYGDKRTIIPFSFPNFKWTKPKSIMLVKFDKKVHKRESHSLRPNHKSYANDLNYEPFKNMEKMSQYKRTPGVDFNKITSRPEGNDPLPSYMRQIFSRQSTSMLNEKALKMNNYADGNFYYTSNTFWPKKSFNKIVNLNLMNSTGFKENFKKDNDDENSEMKEINQFIHKSMKFYSKNVLIFRQKFR